MNLRATRHAWIILTAVGGLAILTATLYPTIYTFDSAEFTIGAVTLGIVHAPGYPLYILAGHLFSQFPVGDPGFRMNLLSALCSITAALLIYRAARRLTGTSGPSAVAAALFFFTPAVWEYATVAEIYAPQNMTIALVVLLCIRAQQLQRRRDVLLTGLAVGLALGVHPGSALLLPGVAGVGMYSIQRRRASWWIWVTAALLSAGVFLASVAYLPVRQAAEPAFTYAGEYDQTGAFRAIDLSAPSGLLYYVSGQQFSDLFFGRAAQSFPDEALGLIREIVNGAGYFGLVLGLMGLWIWRSKQREALVCWLLAVIPFSLFFAAYGAADRATMLQPIYLLLVLPTATALGGLSSRIRAPRLREALAVLLVACTLVPGFLHVTQRNRADVRGSSDRILAALPAQAVVFGMWNEVIALEYLHRIEGQRPDVDIYNVFFFKDSTTIGPLVESLLQNTARPLIFLGDRAPTGVNTRLFNLVPLVYRGEHGETIIAFELERRPA